MTSHRSFGNRAILLASRGKSYPILSKARELQQHVEVAT